MVNDGYRMGFHNHGGTPIAGWFISWKTLLNWMRTGGTPILGILNIWLENQD